jgi:hypothetical protein
VRERVRVKKKREWRSSLSLWVLVELMRNERERVRVRKESEEKREWRSSLWLRNGSWG